MAEETKLKNPWLVAVWPGMGNVAITAGYYLMAKLGMHAFSEVAPGELFDVEHVEVKRGLIRVGERPRSRFFVWSDPKGARDIVVFFGEAQPPLGKFDFCQKLVAYAKSLGVERVFTFAAMATQMRPEDPSRVFVAATDAAILAELGPFDLEALEDGHIGGLNGVLLGAAIEGGLPGACLLGEMSHVFTQMPFPKASLAVLRTFTTMAGIELDFTELEEQARAMEDKLGELLTSVETALEQHGHGAEEREGDAEAWRGRFVPEPEEEPRMSNEDAQRIEELFAQAKLDRSKAYELKRELDRLEVFKEYEDRFLDLFKKRE